MLTGQNTYSFSDKIEQSEILLGIKTASEKLKTIFKNKGLKVHITIFKDLAEDELKTFHKAGFNQYFQFSAQPNMIFDIPNHWKSELDYVDALSKKYRDQYKRARKKALGIEKKKMERMKNHPLS